METKLNINMVFEEAKEGGYIAFIEEIPGVNTQGETLQEAKENLMDALNLTLDFHRERSRKLTGKKRKGIIRESYEFVAA